jgi:hypothetical protein
VRFALAGQGGVLRRRSPDVLVSPP